jgi:hypothetical protein
VEFAHGGGVVEAGINPDIKAATKEVKQKLHEGGKKVSWDCGLATDCFVEHCRGDGGDFAMEQVQAAAIQFGKGHALRLHICQSDSPAKHDGFPGSQGRAAADCG